MLLAPLTRTLPLLAALGLAFVQPQVAAAQSAGPSLVIDAATGAVLHEERASQAWHPASTTKMMTAYVALRAVRAGRIGLETAIPASRLAASQPRVKVYIKPGQEITLDNALKVMMVKSANDIAYVIAEGVGGTVPNFVAMMNAEARRLGLADTEFRNPNGWHHSEQQTSARDLAVLTMTILREFPDYADYWGIGAVQLGKATLTNTNGLIGRYSGANGFKTGFVCASGFNVVATATRGGRTLVAVVLGAYSGAERTVKAAQLLDTAFASWAGTGRNVASMQPSGTAARSICAEVRAFGRGAPLADDVDTVGPISFAPSPNSDWGAMQGGIVSAPAGAGMRSVNGRITLGPRETFVPIQIAYGRSEGSARAPLAANAGGRAPSELAAASSPTAAPPVAAAAAPSGNAARPGAIVPVAGVAALGAAAAFAPAAAGAAGGPIRLHGAIGQTAPATLRPSAAAGIKPREALPVRTGANSPPAGLAVAPSSPPTESRAVLPARAVPAPAAKPQAQRSTTGARPAAGKPTQAEAGRAQRASTPSKPAIAPPRRPLPSGT
jgi:D-alanyl-D-alanine carboxypeptidase